MINYPLLKKGATIGVTAPSSGLNAELHNMFKQCCESMEKKGIRLFVEKQFGHKRKLNLPVLKRGQMNLSG